MQFSWAESLKLLSILSIDQEEELKISGVVQGHKMDL